MNHRRTTSSEWKLLSNTASAQKGSIHDDDAARSLGFRRAFVPGSLVANFAVPSILEHFGSTWLQGGWYDFNFVSPVYIDEEVRTIAGETDGRFACRVETRDGRLCAQGLAGMQAKLPWQTKGALADVFPGAVIGTRFEGELVIRPGDAEPMLKASHDQSTQWRDCVPPEHLMPIALRMVDFKRVALTDVQHPGMWAQHSIALRAPIAWNTPYRMEETLAEKGTSGRTRYLSFQFHLYDEGGNEVAVGRHKCKFLQSVMG